VLRQDHVDAIHLVYHIIDMLLIHQYFHNNGNKLEEAAMDLVGQDQDQGQEVGQKVDQEDEKNENDEVDGDSEVLEKGNQQQED